MSGWIKLEKNRRDDPRVLRMARQLRDAGVTHERFTQQIHVTLILGCLDQFWCYADTHVRDDDTLDLGVDEIDELVGLRGFCDLMPADWLEVIDSQHVKLPEFHTHNGTESKRRALTAKRMQRYRNASASQVRNKVKRNGVTDASPDQDQDQDQDQSKKVPTEPVDSVFQHWQSVHQHPTAKLDTKRRQLIRNALKSYSPDQLCESISGYRNSAHHMGQNDKGAKYDSIELFLRDAKHIDAGLKFARDPPKLLSSNTRSNVAAVEDWEPPEVRCGVQ